MCGRYTLRTPRNEVSAAFRANILPLFADRARYNIAPTQLVPAVVVPAVRQGTDRQLTMLRWGLIPRWAKDAKVGYSLINARSETAAEKPSFRAAMKSRRCLIPADG